jgi:hypothetical protein
MDTNALRSLVEKVLTDYTLIPYKYGDIQIQTVFDRLSDHYLVMLVGRDTVKRVHGCLIHVDIINGQLWIQRDGTENGVARDFLAAGVHSNDIILAFRATPITAAEALATM